MYLDRDDEIINVTKIQPELFALKILSSLIFKFLQYKNCDGDAYEAKNLVILVHVATGSEN